MSSVFVAPSVEISTLAPEGEAAMSIDHLRDFPDVTEYRRSWVDVDGAWELECSRDVFELVTGELRAGPLRAELRGSRLRDGISVTLRMAGGGAWQIAEWSRGTL